MGCGSSIGAVRTLSKEAKDKAEELFTMIDEDGNGSITRDEANKFFKSFAKVNAKAMFDEVDDDGNGSVTKAEFMAFWAQVRTAGYTNKQIMEEIELLSEGGDWVNWKDGKDVQIDAKTEFAKPKSDGGDKKKEEEKEPAKEAAKSDEVKEDASKAV
mmetsp:Transcript_102436/g.181931  ORF Transcript_102436/g.181931 Transcript_102436/m.181931 type:complete len:157 (+) Transcript_102436:44-514(+)